MSAGVLYKLDAALRVSASVELVKASNDGDGVVPAGILGLGTSFLSHVGCAHPGHLIKSVEKLCKGEDTIVPTYHRWGQEGVMSMSESRRIAAWLLCDGEFLVIELPQGSSANLPTRAVALRGRGQRDTVDFDCKGLDLSSFEAAA
eukprot:CAMPEP_0206809384 /NCGR_PEP_ID=MMETSP0975-20121206/6218_1 /ASSEMBLY_ACC=CAM_ASM_000399 /TAXON_ID=483370 /ORGANISM="non described non described, Strain CCMP2097" /LENGTH=145 /DNA_ID=CAMNT_0054351481 /DNA_START=109 /DNA_END=542 /DNA_ORIENTATION=-